MTDIPSKPRLVVIIGGWLEKEKGTRDVCSAVDQAYPAPETDVLLVRTGFSFFGAPMIDCTVSIMAQINAQCRACRYDEVVLIGYSMGALALRKAWMAAQWLALTEKTAHEPAGFIENELVEEAARAREWIGRVRRVVLLGSIDLGWQLSHHINLVIGIVAWPLTQLCRFLREWVSMPIFDCERGQPFVENLRVQWGRLLHQMDRQNMNLPLVVQLFGTLDEVVGPLEAVDPLYVSKTTGDRPAKGQTGRYVCVEVPESGHETLVYMADAQTLDQRRVPQDEAERQRQSKRRELFLKALTAPREALEKIEAHLVEESQLRKPDPKVKHVVFVIHGIRDTGYWTQHVAQRIKSQASTELHEDVRFVSETSTYGYFAMLPFVASRSRRKKVQWLFDQYAENVMLYPEAAFHFVGHSNGTYMLARALELSPCIRFENVAFAGSVVRCDYPWTEVKQRGQIKRFANYLATCDWVVGVFPWAMGMIQACADHLRLAIRLTCKRDLGAGGDAGFSECSRRDADLSNVGPVGGGHGAAIQERNWPFLASFILKPHDPPAACESKPRQSLGIAAYRVLFGCVLALLISGLVVAWPWSGWNAGGWGQGLGYAFGVVVLYKALTRL